MDGVVNFEETRTPLFWGEEGVREWNIKGHQSFTGRK